MDNILRYSTIEAKNEREIVLLKGRPCKWGKCAFCDYISDNSINEALIEECNKDVLSRVTGRFQKLEVINSGSVFELTENTLGMIKHIVTEKDIQKLFFECHWLYRSRLKEIEDFFERPIIFKCGIETFDNEFRNNVLRKGFVLTEPAEAAKYFESICLMVGVKGQTKEMIKKDIDFLLRYFKYGCINIFNDNSTNIKSDEEIIGWFKDNYSYINNYPNIEVLWQNTDFNVGGIINE